MPSKGQIEDAISKEFTKFFINSVGNGPKEIKTYIIDDMVVVRISDNFSSFSKVLLNKSSSEDIQIIKDMYRKTREYSINELNQIVEKHTQLKVISSHHDISTKTAERVEVFILEKNFFLTKN